MALLGDRNTSFQHNHEDPVDVHCALMLLLEARRHVIMLADLMCFFAPRLVMVYDTVANNNNNNNDNGRVVRPCLQCDRLPLCCFVTSPERKLLRVERKTSTTMARHFGEPLITQYHEDFTGEIITQTTRSRRLEYLASCSPCKP
jgi:hypothetical protein